jgi:RimJ/RimL family protein N-acetyltransferase
MTGPASRRLDLPPLTVEALAALIAGDRSTLEAATGACFPEPLVAPPLMEDALPAFLDALRADPAAPWWARLIVLRETGEAAGSIGFSGLPDDSGTVTMGYSLYPAFQGKGIASEAARALVAWALAQPGVRGVRATIRPGHIASERVAAAAGLRRTGRIEDDPDEGPVEVWESAAEDEGGHGA